MTAAVRYTGTFEIQCYPYSGERQACAFKLHRESKSQALLASRVTLWKKD